MKYKTGEICPLTGTYRWAGHADGTISCSVTHEEYTIPMTLGNPFPPTRHCEKAAFWEFLR